MLTRIANIERFVLALRESGNIMEFSDYSAEWRDLLEKVLQLDASDITGESLHQFCLALADLFEAVLG